MKIPIKGCYKINKGSFPKALKTKNVESQSKHTKMHSLFECTSYTWVELLKSWEGYDVMKIGLVHANLYCRMILWNSFHLEGLLRRVWLCGDCRFNSLGFTSRESYHCQKSDNFSADTSAVTQNCCRNSSKLFGWGAWKIGSTKNYFFACIWDHVIGSACILRSLWK